MARLIAIDWSNRECRAVIAQQHRQNVSVEAVLVRSWANDASGDTDGLIGEDIDSSEKSAADANRQIADTFKSMLADHKISRSAVLVGVQRSQIELFDLSFPKIDEDALPAVVQNSAIQQSPNVTDESIVDFVSRKSGTEGNVKVLATALSLSECNQIQSTVDGAGLNAEKLLFRPFAAASLIANSSLHPTGHYLLVNLVDDEVDLSVVMDGEVTFSRTTRLAGDISDADTGKRLNAEIARTLTVVSQNRDEGPSSIVVFGNPAESSEWVEQLKSQLTLDVMVVDPFLLVDSAPDDLPNDVGRFASLLGMIDDEVAGRSPAVDFLNPREVVQPTDRKKQIYAVAGVLACLIFAGGYMLWQQLADYDEEIAFQNDQLKTLKSTEKKIASKKKVADAIRNWESGEVNWLDELRDLSVRWPGSQDVVISRMLMSPSRGGGGVINLQGMASQAAVVRQIEERIRDEYRVVRAPRLQERESSDGLNWSFEASVSVRAREKEAYRPEWVAKKKAEALAAKEKKSSGKTKSKSKKQ